MANPFSTNPEGSDGNRPYGDPYAQGESSDPSRRTTQNPFEPESAQQPYGTQPAASQPAYGSQPYGAQAGQSYGQEYGQYGQEYGQTGSQTVQNPFETAGQTSGVNGQPPYGAPQDSAGTSVNPAYEPQGNPGLYGQPAYVQNGSGDSTAQSTGAVGSAYGPQGDATYGQPAYGQSSYGQSGNPYDQTAGAEPAYGENHGQYGPYGQDGQPVYGQPAYGQNNPYTQSAYGQPDYTQTGYASQPYPGQPYAGQPYGGYGYYPQEPGWNAMAIAGFVCSFIIAIVGLVLSIIGLSQIKRTGEKGRGLAIAGIIISAIQTVIVGIFIAIFVAALSSGVSHYSTYDDYGEYDDAGDYGYYQDAEPTDVAAYVSGADGSSVSCAASHAARIDAVIAATYAAL